MSDVQYLFAILGVLYFWECACWLRRGGVAFSTGTGWRWRVQHPATMLGNQTGGFVLAPPLPPLGTIFTAQQFPFSLGPEGVLLFVSPNVNPGWRPAQSSRFLTWEETAQLRVAGKKLLVQNKKIFAAPTVTFAAHLFKTLTTIATLPREQREAAIKKNLQDGFDSNQIEVLRRDFNQQIRPIRLLANALILLVFVVAPALIWLIGLKTVWLGLLIVLLGLTITTATFFARLHRKLYPVAADERFTHSLIIALAPASTMRAHDLVSRPLLENFHPLAVAKNLLASDDFNHFTRRILLDLRHPVPPTCPNSLASAVATEAFHRRHLLEAAEVWLTENKLSPDELCRPPVPTDESCRAYCPRCESQFISTSGQCADCGGLALVAFRKAS